ncbi:hypothetical protein [Aureitalea marina]|uniref:Uncharacterized protein n=1 Tax=Aureitalea marina TaxID=930804 RepID=A0A2S7KRX7_9FLAO|nr:hypothetical protein [Aureitalea marina]PQB05382.1 hypothetical protein BST85_11150 [Aureitalea marina]
MRLSLLLPLVLLSASLIAQEGQHKNIIDIFHKGEDIGDLTASKRVNGNSVTYRVQTDIT